MGRLTLKQFRKGIPEILSLLENQVFPQNASDKKDRCDKAKKNFWFFFRNYLPHYASDKTPLFHKEIIKSLEQCYSFTAIAAPRGFSKSTLVSFAYILWKIINGQRRFIVLVSATDKLAVDLAGFIRIELQENRRILEDFGTLYHGGSEGDFLASQTRVLALGRRQALRGFRNRQHRPDLIVLDDIEKDEEALSPLVVRKTLDLITNGLIPSLDPKNMQLVFVGTIQQARSAAGIILKGSDEPFCSWNRQVYQAITKNQQGKELSIWENRFPLKKLQEIRRQIGEAAFQSEYQNNPADKAGAMFRPEWFAEGPDDVTAPVALYIDPSPDGIKDNDYKAAIFLTKAYGRYVILDAVFTQGSDLTFFRDLIHTYSQYRSRIVCVAGEANGFQGYFLKDLKDAFSQSGIILPVHAQKNRLNKKARIARLVGWMETGRLVFAPAKLKTPWAKILKEQLEYFPSPSVHDDGPDALEGALAVLEERCQKGSVAFLPKSPNKFQI